jgi:hypothetical protein
MNTRFKAQQVIDKLTSINENDSCSSSDDSDRNDSDESLVEDYAPQLETESDFSFDSDEEIEIESENESEDEFEINNSNSPNTTENALDECIDAVVARYTNNNRSKNSNSNSTEGRIEFTASDNTIWHRLGSENFIRSGPISRQNVFTENSGLTNYANKSIDSNALSAFFCILDKSILKHIVECTNAESIRQGFDFKIEMIDILSFIALLYIRGAYCQKLSVKAMWSENFGLPIIKKIMSRDKFLKIMRFLRFDDKASRQNRIISNKFAMADEIWTRFINNSQACYKPSAELTIDEQLLPCKSRCPFIQFMPNKPDKFGIKFWLLCEVESKYVCNGFPYLGKDNLRAKDEQLGESVVKRLMEPYLKKGYHVTTDNFFSSRKLALYLLENKTSFLGTLKGNRKEIPVYSANKKKTKDYNMKLYESEFFKDDAGCLLTIYQCKPKKNVITLSTLHDNIFLENSEKRKPNTILSYNSTKFGVDVVDYMTREYNVKAPTRRWPVQVFYNIINLAAINAWILYKKKNHSSISRQDFLGKLIEEIKNEKEMQNIKKLSNIVNCPSPNTLNKRKTCQIGFCSGNKTQHVCSICKLNTCGVCKFEDNLICKKCSN